MCGFVITAQWPSSLTRSTRRTYYLASPTSPAPPPFLGMTKSETLPGFMVYEDLVRCGPPCFETPERRVRAQGSVSASTPTSLSPGLRRLSVVFPDASTDDTQRDLDECYSRVVSQCVPGYLLAFSCRFSEQTHRARGRGANALTQVQVGRNEAGRCVRPLFSHWTALIIVRTVSGRTAGRSTSFAYLLLRPCPLHLSFSLPTSASVPLPHRARVPGHRGTCSEALAKERALEDLNLCPPHLYHSLCMHVLFFAPFMEHMQ